MQVLCMVLNKARFKSLKKEDCNMKLTFEPVTNKIGNDYFIVPKNDADNVKCVIKCNEVTAFIVNLLVNDMKRDDMVAATAAQYPNSPLTEIEEVVDYVRSKLKRTLSQKTSNEGEI